METITYGMDALFCIVWSISEALGNRCCGNLVYGSNTDEAKTALAEIRKLVEDGTIDASFTVRDSDQCAELVTSGQAGIFLWCMVEYELAT